MSDEPQHCGACRFYLERSDVAHGGFCRRYPPHMPTAWSLWRGRDGAPDDLALANNVNDAWPNVGPARGAESLTATGRSNMLAMIELNWGANDKIKALPREKYEQLRELLPQMNLAEWKADAEKQPYIYVSGDVLADLTTDGHTLERFGLEYTVKRFKNTYRATTIDSAGNTFNTHVHIPNIGLLAIDEVFLLSDACTDSLQRYLDDGYRILAVCPPSAQRRPDYILGRTKESSK